MARVMVQIDKNRVILVDERNVRPMDEKNVRPIQLGSEQSAGQLLDRIGWAIGDARRRTARRTMRKYVAAVVPPSVGQQSIRTAKAQGRARLGGGGGVTP